MVMLSDAQKSVDNGVSKGFKSLLQTSSIGRRTLWFPGSVPNFLGEGMV